MKYLCFALTLLTVAIALPRIKREAYLLPDGAELIVGSIKTTFNCQGRVAGYYADVDNNCQIFHVCNPIVHADGTEEVEHHSFFCGNQTVFNQLTMTCAFPEDAVPCNDANNFFYLNNRIGIPDEFFLKDEDIEKGRQSIDKGR